MRQCLDSFLPSFGKQFSPPVGPPEVSGPGLQGVDWGLEGDSQY